MKKPYNFMEDMRRLRDDFDNFFRNNTKDLLPARNPVTDMYETESNIVITAELPGVKKENIDINVHEDNIEINVEDSAKTKTKDENQGTYYIERSSKSFYRRYSLPNYADTKKANATFKNGLLKIEIKKDEPREDKGNSLEIK